MKGNKTIKVDAQDFLESPVIKAQIDQFERYGQKDVKELHIKLPAIGLASMTNIAKLLKKSMKPEEIPVYQDETTRFALHKLGLSSLLTKGTGESGKTEFESLAGVLILTIPWKFEDTRTLSDVEGTVHVHLLKIKDKTKTIRDVADTDEMVVFFDEDGNDVSITDKLTDHVKLLVGRAEDTIHAERMALLYMFQHVTLYIKELKGDIEDFDDVTEDNMKGASPSEWGLRWGFSRQKFEIVTDAKDHVTAIVVHIKENRRSGDEVEIVLDSSMKDLPKLERLDLSGVNCQIHDDPPGFSKFANIKILSLANMYFDYNREMTEVMKQFPKLEELSLDNIHEQTFEIEEDISSFLPNLRKLSIQRMKAKFSPWITKLNLTTLRLSNTELEGPLPDNIGDMVTLTSLDLNRNDLDDVLPDSFNQLTNLTNLNLYANRGLEGTIPPEIYNLPGLNLDYDITRLRPPAEENQ